MMGVADALVDDGANPKEKSTLPCRFIRVERPVDLFQFGIVPRRTRDLRGFAFFLLAPAR